MAHYKVITVENQQIIQAYGLEGLSQGLIGDIKTFLHKKGFSAAAEALDEYRQNMPGLELID
jgi:hypothetical protein